MFELSFSPPREAIYWKTNFVETYANFVVSNWNTETGKWSAKITGTIAPGLNGVTQLRGGAAGTGTSRGTGNITETASGIPH